MKMDFASIFLSKGLNYFSDDVPLNAILKYLKISQDKNLIDLGRFVSDELIEVSAIVDHYAKPVLQTWSITDERLDSIWLSPEHSRMLSKMQKLGVVRSAVEPGGTIKHFLSGYIISDPGFYCTLTLTAQTAYALHKYGDSGTRGEFLPRYLDPDDPWYGATYYTEIQGGSDLGANRASASFVNGRWIIDSNDKYFASNAGLADGSIVTARPAGSESGTRGLAVFFVPARNSKGELNYYVRRLKDKLGTISVPTGEVEMIGSEAYLLGERKYGIYYAMEILMISRIDDAISAAGIARKALWESYLYACSRMAFGRKIIDHPLLLRDFLEMEADLEASLVLSLLAADLFSKASSQKPPYDEIYHKARVLSHIAKNNASWVSDAVTRYCMEIFGGKGFLKEFPIEKFHRDSIVTSIWEGTSNIQALDLMELLQKKKIHLVLKEELLELIESLSDRSWKIKVVEAVLLKFESVERWLSSKSPEIHAKDILNALAYSISLAHLFRLSDLDLSGRFSQVASIYYYTHFMVNDEADVEFAKSTAIDWMKRV
jgi:acyl-CoA dehydrogenase